MARRDSVIPKVVGLYIQDSVLVKRYDKLAIRCSLCPAISMAASTIVITIFRRLEIRTIRIM